MEFEWDEVKVDSNFTKHGVAFVAAIRVFDDANLLIRVDPRAYNEPRWQAIGMVEDLVLFVVYTLRHGNSCRVISARRANRREREDYTLQARD
jgi:uncharacterized DUF497 family protein